MTGAEGLLLAHRLGVEGFDCTPYRYGSVAQTTVEVIDGLARAVAALPSPVRFVGHSLGGLVVLRYLETHPDVDVGPVVLLGSPVAGSRAASGLARLPGAEWLLGGIASHELLTTGARVWRRSTPLGVIAGDVPLGFGRLIAELPLPHDGAVSVAETQLPGACEHRVLPVNHMGLLASAQVAQATAAFLRDGRFPAPGS
jgi:pimeloyl-ACP methyl ester carboxylesterase